MATVIQKILEHQQKADGTWNVKISVCHKGLTKYIETSHFVSRNQLTRDYKTKDPFLKKILNKTLDDYRYKISELGEKIKLFNVQNLNTISSGSTRM